MLAGKLKFLAGYAVWKVVYASGQAC